MSEPYVSGTFVHELIIEKEGGEVLWLTEGQHSIERVACLSESPEVPLELEWNERTFVPLSERERAERRQGMDPALLYIPPWQETRPLVASFKLQLSSKYLGVLWPQALQLPEPLTLRGGASFFLRGPKAIIVLIGRRYIAAHRTAQGR